MPDDTVCVIASVSGKLYTALNRRENINGTVRNIHAEAEAIRSMQAASETMIRTILLISCANGMPLLPCDNCMRSIVALNPDNIRCEIMMMDRAVSMSEFRDRILPRQNMQMSQMSQPYAQAKPTVTSVSAVSMQVPEASNDANLLKSRVNSLLSAATDDDDEEETKHKPEKKGFFGGLFGKK